MSKNRSKPNALCRRLAALLAALALLAAMALPVYAEAQDEAALQITETAADVTADTETDTTDTAVSADPADSEDKKETEDNEDAETTGENETPAADPTQETPTDDTTDADTAGETTDTPDDAEDVTDIVLPDDNQEQDADEAEAVSLDQVPATQADGGITCIVYFAVPKDWENEGYTTEADHIIYLNVQYAKNPAKWKQFAMEDSGFVTENGCKIYQATVEKEYCPYDGFDTIQFQKYIGGAYQDQIVAAKEYRKMTPVDADDKGDFFDGTTWSTYTPNYNDHTRLGGQKMVFENKTNETLINVTAHFYEPDVNGDLVEVGTGISLGDVATNGKAEVTIPKEKCSYVRFTTGDGTALSKYYNFYGQAVDGDDKASFKYFANKTYAYIYSGSGTAWWGVPGTIRVYYDATFSKLATTGTNDTGGDFSIPASGSNTIYYRITGNAKESKNGTLIMDASNENLYYVDVPEGYEKIVFSADTISNDNQTIGNGKSTAWLSIPTDDKNCYYADSNDTVVYSANTRDGYWAPVGTLRDAETWKQKDVVDIKSDTFTADSKTKYVDSTLYDYYTDYELNGTARNTYATSFGNNKFESHRNWMPFRQFNQALSSYYEEANAGYPIYTGHFQPKYSNWAYPFDQIASALNLYGYDATNRFIAINNSTLNEDNKDGYYDYAYQGLVAKQTSTGTSDGEPLLAGTSVTEPHFNKAFLAGDNSKNAKLGEVFEKVKFPFTKKQVFNNDEGVEYWYFDSQDTTLYLKQDANSGYFLKPDTLNREKSRNLDAGSNKKTISVNNQTVASYGYFPFNETAVDGCASTYNYGFGTKLQLSFTLTDDAQVETSKTNSDGTKQKTSIKFFFSGDDDVWVFIDGKLALDVGGAHGKVSGLLEFGQTADGTQNSVTAYVSNVKKGGTSASDQNGEVKKSIVYNGQTIDFHAEGDTLYLEKGKAHTLTFYYMERGMWESNMAIAFNFPDHNELQVEKEVNVDNVDPLFQGFFKDHKLFNFTIENQATHYGTYQAATSTTQTINLLEPSKNTEQYKYNYTYTLKPATENNGDLNVFRKATSPPDTDANTPVLEWYAQFEDLKPSPGTYKDARYGILTLDNNATIDISKMSYLTFDVYVAYSGGTAALSNMYMQLVDNQNRVKGCLDNTFLNSAIYGQVEMKNQEWITVKLDLNKMKAESGFDWTQVTGLKFGCNYPRTIYLRNIVFSSKTEATKVTGFTTKQEDIPDYGSASSGTLMPAENAQYTSTKEDGTMVVDAKGGFVLEDEETITFKDQFRRGSYLSINETTDTDLFDTTWTIYENGQAVTTQAGKKVSLQGESQKLEDVPGTGPDDGRVEVTNAEGDQAQDPSGNHYDGTKPQNANTIVFRSYLHPDVAEGDGMTKLKVRFVNKVKTGSLTIRKLADSSGETLNGTYTFTVRFTNVGGHALEDEPIVETVKLKAGEYWTLSGIPVGTRFTIREEDPGDGSKLLKVTVTGGGADTEVLSDNSVRGSISGTAEAEVAFTNTKQQLLDITGKKVWLDADGKPLTGSLPTIYVQLQRKLQTESDDKWTAVEYQGKQYTPVTNGYDGMKFSFLGQPAKDYSQPDKPDYEYRVVEGYLNGTTFVPVEPDGTITIDGKVYKVMRKDVTPSDGKQEETLTNQLQKPEFTLDITKKDAENTATLLEGVEFTLEKLDADGKVDSSFPMQTGITNGNGELILKDVTPATKGFVKLEAGTYRLTETKAAENYNLLSAPILITFDNDGKCTLDGTQVTDNKVFTGDAEHGYTLSLTVLNRKTPTLPHTGADAPSLWLLIGLPLAVAGLLILVFRYNKKGGRSR